MINEPLKGASREGRMSEQNAVEITGCADEYLRLEALKDEWSKRTGAKVVVPAGLPDTHKLEAFLLTNDHASALIEASNIRAVMKSVFKQFEETQ
jgi:hypothetical protein